MAKERKPPLHLPAHPSKDRAARERAALQGVPQMLSFLSVTSAADVLLGEIRPEDIATPSLNGASSEEGRAPAHFYASSRGGGFRIAIGEVEYRLLQEQGAVVLPR